MNKKIVTVFGDSICTGEGVPPHLTWVHKLSQGFPNIIIHNESLNGETTRMALLRMHYNVTSKHNDVLIINYGLNDCNRWQTEHGLPRVSPNSFKANIYEMLTRSEAAGIEDVLIITPHPVPIPKYNSKDLPIYCQNIRDAADEFSSQDHKAVVLVLSVDRCWEDDGIDSKTMLLDDGIHLNDRGHYDYYERIGTILNGMLQCAE